MASARRKLFFNKKRQNILPEKIRDKLTKTNLVLLLVFLIFLLLFRNSILPIMLMALFLPFTYYTVKYSKIVPHVTIASNTPCSAFMGAVFGMKFGFYYALAAGIFAYFGNGHTKITHMATIILASLTAASAGFYMSYFDSFAIVFVLAILTRTVIAMFIFPSLGVEPLETLTHQFGQLGSNLILYLPILNSLYNFVIPFV